MQRIGITLIGLSMTGVVLACCGVGSVAVHFKGQQNVIVWDPSTKTEHFVRRAAFETAGKDLGFIAPTPSVPELAEASPEVFARLARLAPRTRNLGPEAAKGTESAGGVHILQQVEVAGYQATTIRASNADALHQWMQKNGYNRSPGVDEWTSYYVRKGWFLTLFKVSKTDGEAVTGLVRMSFKTDRPFNPYYVPPENRHPASRFADDGGLLVYFISTGTFEPLDRTRHGLRRMFGAPIPDGVARDVAADLGIDGLPSGATVTAFRDEKFPDAKANADVYFQPAPTPGSDGTLIVSGAALLGVLGAIAVRARKTRH